MTNAKERLIRNIKIAEYCINHTLYEAMKEFNLGKNTIKDCCKMHNIAVNHNDAQVSSFKILKKLLNGISQTEISKEFNISRQRIYQIKGKALAAGFELK